MATARWEHGHAYVESEEDVVLTAILEKRSKEGWELVSVIEQQDEGADDKHLHLFFKRPAA